MSLTLGELLLECGLKIVRQEKKIKQLKAKVASLEASQQQPRRESKP